MILMEAREKYGGGCEKYVRKAYLYEHTLAGLAAQAPCDKISLRTMSYVVVQQKTKC